MLRFSDQLAKMRWQRSVALLLALAVQTVFWGVLSQTVVRDSHNLHAASPMLMELSLPAVTVAVSEYKPHPELSPSVTQAVSRSQKRKRTADNSSVISSAIYTPGLNSLPDSTPQQPADVAPPAVAKSREGEVLDVEKLKAQARYITRESDAGKRTANVAQSEASLSGEKMQKALAKAVRPKCDNDYAPAIGVVKFEGLFKVPFLVAEAVSDKGCKW